MKYRSHEGDPFYESTDNWKTLRQWHDLGYVLRHDFKTKSNVFRYILGYRSAMCDATCFRYHRSAMRLVVHRKKVR